MLPPGVISLLKTSSFIRPPLEATGDNHVTQVSGIAALPKLPPGVIADNHVIEVSTNSNAAHAELPPGITSDNHVTQVSTNGNAVHAELPPGVIVDNHMTQVSTNGNAAAHPKVKVKLIEDPRHDENTFKIQREDLCAPTPLDKIDCGIKLGEISKRDLNLLKFTHAKLYDFPTQVPPVHPFFFNAK